MHAPLNILVLCYEYPPIGGGGGVGAKQYAEAWAAQGHRVTALTSWDKGLPRRARVGGVDVVRVLAFGKKNRATATNLSMACYLVFGALHLLLRVGRFRRFDVINTHFSIPTGLLGVVARRVLSTPNLLTIIGGDIYDPTKTSSPHRSALLRRVNSFVINDAEAVVAISSDTKRRAEQHYDIRRPIGVINYGFIPVDVPETDRTELGLRQDRYYLVSVGRLVERKGFDHLIRAVAELPPDIHLLIVGDGPLESSLRDLAARTGVDDRVTMLGYVPRDGIWTYLAAADCYVLSSIHEGLGIVVQEAMHAGLPIVATDNGGQVDLVRQERNGLLVPPADPGSLAAAIRRLHADRGLAASMSRNNRRDLERLYMSSNAGEYIELFRSMIAAERGESDPAGALSRSLPPSSANAGGRDDRPPRS
jgi:glycosyltransferase involved in cell wall biosynthesis